MEGYISEIRMWGPTWSPRNWLLCQGQLLAIASNTALFSLIGTLYGGDGRTTFALPDLRGRAAIGTGNGPGLTPRINGQRGGQEYHTLNINEIPAHSHSATATTSINGGSVSVNASTTPNQQAPTGNYWASGGLGTSPYSNVKNTTMAADAVDLSGLSASTTVTVFNTGGNLSHNIMQPWECVSFIMCQFGIFPSRS